RNAALGPGLRIGHLHELDALVAVPQPAKVHGLPERNVLDDLEIEHVDIELGDCLDVRDRIGGHEVAQRYRGRLLRAGAERRENRACQRQCDYDLLHALSLSFTICPPLVSRTALPISSSSTGRPCSLSQKADRKL